MKITYEQIKALNPCWSDEDLQEKLPLGKKKNELTIDRLKGLSQSNARWLVSKLMTRPMLIVWAQTCAKRAKKYADADAAADAADAADVDAWAADADAAADVEHLIAMKHAISLLNGKGIK